MKTIRISDLDNVAVALHPIAEGEEITAGGITVKALMDIPQGHKIALLPIKKGENVVKYGFPIGHATEDAAPGTWMHTHNVKTNLEGEMEYTYTPSLTFPEKVEPETFQGFRRKDGRAAIRNEIWIIPTVGCVNDVAKKMVRDNQDLVTGTIDGLYTFPHPFGCSQTGEDHAQTRKLLAALVRHPNAAAVLVLGLGCENLTHEQFLEELGDYDKDRVKFLICQEAGDEFSEGRELLKQCAEYASQFKREPIPVSELVIGMKCGGSDGFSGISANPVIGEVSDRVVTLGGGSALAEFPELCGVEANMISRCIRKEDKARFLELMRRYEAAANACGASISDNPSPGNIHDGLITDAIKSAGAAKKGGKAPISAVLDYAEPMPDSGLSLVCTPGNDVEAVTGLVAAGVNVVLFSTGLGTPTGNPIVPVIKVATNTAVAERLSDLIDFDCGPIIDGEPIAAAADRLLEKVLDTASGRYSTKADRLGQHDFLFWKREVSL